MSVKTSVVAHMHHVFLQKSETFIFNYVSHLNKFYPIYLAGKFINLKQFHLLEKDCYKVFCKKFTFLWLFYGFVKKIFGIDILAEKVIRDRKVQLIHTHFGYNAKGSLRLKRKFSVPLITTFYGKDISEVAKIPKWQRFYRKLFHEGNLFLVEGEFMKSSLVSLGCPVNKIKIQRIAIPVDKILFAPRKAKGKDERVVLIFSGRFIEKKGLIYALKAVKRVRASYSNFEFRIIGDGPLRPTIEKYIIDFNMKGYVKLLGFLDYDYYLKESYEADIFVHPSITSDSGDSEGGAPTTILEAQAAGMPVVSTYHADIPNIVVPGKSALLSKERDSEELAGNICFLLENQESWYEMGKSGREFVEMYHDINQEIKNLEGIYSNLLKCK